jgi:transcriptional regulator with XRE-family HTH domain
MLIQDRIKLIIKVNNESPSSFADKIGIKRANLSHVLSGRNKPSLDFLSKVISSYPSVNASWLITGVTRDGDLEGTSEKKPDKEVVVVVQKEIEQIIVTYADGTFKVYNP